MSVPGCVTHSFNLLKSESTLIQWVCNRCHTGPHWYIFECKCCKLNACQTCTNESGKFSVTPVRSIAYEKKKRRIYERKEAFDGGSDKMEMELAGTKTKIERGPGNDEQENHEVDKEITATANMANPSVRGQWLPPSKDNQVVLEKGWVKEETSEGCTWCDKPTSGEGTWCDKLARGEGSDCRKEWLSNIPVSVEGSTLHAERLKGKARTEDNDREKHEGEDKTTKQEGEREEDGMAWFVAALQEIKESNDF